MDWIIIIWLVKGDGGSVAELGGDKEVLPDEKNRLV